MLKTSHFILLLKTVFLTAVLHSTAVQAGLLISPMLLTFNDRERSKEVILINKSDQTTTYRLIWKQNRAKPNGGYDELSEQESKEFPIASSMIRFSPKQVRLGPGERQIVKLAVRRPKNLAQGEYRSHLLFSALPQEKNKDVISNGPTNLTVQVMLSYSIPVIVRSGEKDYSVTIDDAKVLTSQKKGKTQYQLEVAMSRTGINSTAGSIKAYWKKNGSREEVHIGTLNSVQFYPELETSKYNLFWQGPEVALKSGKLRVVYEGRKDFSGLVLAEKTFTL